MGGDVRRRAQGAERRTGETGDNLITFALLMVVLLLFLALAVDVGHIYQQRRFMQNAADAGALAGAREICFGSPARAEETARDYAVARNGADDAFITIDDWVVHVSATIESDLFFAGIIGMDRLRVGAVAEAACGTARTACGLWPLGLSETAWQGLEVQGCGQPFYIWAGDTPLNDPNCSVYDCDVDGDGRDEVLPSYSRAWLDFSDVLDPEHPDECVAPGCDDEELRCLLQRDSGAMVSLPACVAADTGVRSNTKPSIESRVGQPIALPLYLYVDCGGPTCLGSSIWVEAFGCIEVLGWLDNLVLPHRGGGAPWQGPVIVAAISCDSCETYCGATAGGSPTAGDVRAVSLVE